MLLFVPVLSFDSLSVSKSKPAFSIYIGKINHKTDAGTWSFELYGSNIIKTTFHPRGYTTNEQVSNAVIQKPSPGKKITLKKDDQIPEFRKAAKVLNVGECYSYQFGDDKKELLAEYFYQHQYNGFRFQLQAGEQIYGGGERALPLNRRGYGFSLNNSPAFGYVEGENNLNYSVPFIISSKGYGVFFDNPSNGYLDIGNKDPGVLEVGFTSGELTFYIINGKNADEILKHYTHLVGRQQIPARWVFGNLMSRFGYRSEEQLLATVAKMKEEDFPVDAVILDLFWFGDSIKNTMGNLDWGSTNNWPNPTRMIADLKEQGIKTILITEPYVLAASKNYERSKDFQAVDIVGKPYVLSNFYFGQGGLLDLFRKDAQDWFWTKYKDQIEKGVSGWWGDLGEPETHPADMYHDLKDLCFQRLFRSGEVHNIYAHYWNKMLFEKYLEEYPDVRLFNLNRSGYAGSQRYSVFPWTGDVGRNWSGFRAQLPIMLGMSLSGVPYIHSDAGGFAMGEKDPELYTRWLQFAAFTPVFRPHGTALGDLDNFASNIESEPVYYPDPYKSIVRRYIQLRYDLMPYNYTLAYQQAKEGKSLARPMFYYDSNDQNLLNAEDQYMWGDSILVAPVLQRGAIERTVYLPVGDWYDYLSNKKLAGGRWINQSVDIHNIPIYVKAGSFIPTSPDLRNMEDFEPGCLQVTYYPGSCSSSYTMYEDDGKTNLSFEKGHYELLNFESRPEGERFFLQVSSDYGRYEGRPSVRTIVLTIPGLTNEPLEVKLNCKVLKVNTIFDHDNNSLQSAVWDPAAMALTLVFGFSDATQVIEIIK